LKLDKEQE